MTQKSLSSETCLGYLSALQVHAFCRRRGIALATTRHRHFPSKAASRDQANDLTIRTCDPYLPAGIPMPLHCVSSSASTPRSAEFRKPHLCRLPLSGNALQRWNESILLSSPSLAFIQEASLRSFVDTLVLGFELCGTYQQKTLTTSTVYGTQPLTSVRKIRGFLERNSRLFGAQRARAAASYLVDGSASPRETQAALLLGLPAFYGGYGLGMPSMNYEISCTPEATAISGRHQRNGRRRRQSSRPASEEAHRKASPPTARDSHQSISPRCHTCSSILAAARKMASFLRISTL